MNLLPQRYWDSNVFLGWLNNEQKCFDICNALIEDARSGKHRLVTSTLTYVEVFWIRGGLPQPQQIDAIKALFGHSCIVPAELDHPTADLARELMFEFSQNDGLQAKDAVHLATAIRARALGNVECFDTWDGGLANLEGQLTRLERLQKADSGADLSIGIPKGQLHLLTSYSEPAQPSSRSGDDDSRTASAPSPDRPSTHPSDQAPPQQDSSDRRVPHPQTEQ